MTDRLFASPSYPAVPAGDAVYPVHRLFCVGRNYVAHAREMGAEVDRAAPFYFMKDARHLVQSGATIPYPPGTGDFQHEIELVVAIGAEVPADAGSEVAHAAIWGYGCGLDMTRRDLQQAAKDRGRPWDLGKNVENSAVMSGLVPARDMGEIGPQRIWLSVNGTLRQEAHLRDMIWSPAELVAHLAGYYSLAPGDVIMTGTPAGVGPVGPGDVLAGGIDALPGISLTLAGVA